MRKQEVIKLIQEAIKGSISDVDEGYADGNQGFEVCQPLIDRIYKAIDEANFD
ncbi:hypothetical protein M0R04_14435 [Candidatus Dojkabacteria bacterium]|jgi:hypothetical protein|nr:hypothetical protein [Candidatus Dojkabacteria bacterium]